MGLGSNGCPPVTQLLDLVGIGRLGMAEKVLEDKEKHPSTFKINLATSHTRHLQEEQEEKEFKRKIGSGFRGPVS